MLRMVGDGTYLSVGEAAEVLGVSPQTVRNVIKAGRLKMRRTPGGHRRVLAADAHKLRTELDAAAEAESTEPA